MTDVRAEVAGSRLGTLSASGQTSAARDLVAGGADVDARDSRGLTPVMLAVLGGHLETAVQLALSGADLGCRDPEGRTALELAVLSSNREVRAGPYCARLDAPAGCPGVNPARKGDRALHMASSSRVSDPSFSRICPCPLRLVWLCCSSPLASSHAASRRCSRRRCCSGCKCGCWIRRGRTPRQRPWYAPLARPSRRAVHMCNWRSETHPFVFACCARRSCSSMSHGSQMQTARRVYPMPTDCNLCGASFAFSFGPRGTATPHCASRLQHTLRKSPQRVFTCRSTWMRRIRMAIPCSML